MSGYVVRFPGLVFLCKIGISGFSEPSCLVCDLWDNLAGRCCGSWAGYFREAARLAVPVNSCNACLVCDPSARSGVIAGRRSCLARLRRGPAPALSRPLLASGGVLPPFAHPEGICSVVDSAPTGSRTNCTTAIQHVTFILQGVSKAMKSYGGG